MLEFESLSFINVELLLHIKTCSFLVLLTSNIFSAIVFHVTKLFQHNFCHNKTCVTQLFCDPKTPFRLAPLAGKYLLASLEQISSPDSPSAVHDRVCSLKRSGVCSAYFQLDEKWIRQNFLWGLFKASALWADAFYKSKCPSVCVSVCPCVHFWGTI